MDLKISIDDEVYGHFLNNKYSQADIIAVHTALYFAEPLNGVFISSWIPISERPPEESGRYLAYIVNEYDNKLHYIMTCNYSVDGHHWNWFPDDECASDNVMAWMPLPETYSESKHYTELAKSYVQGLRAGLAESEG